MTQAMPPDPSSDATTAANGLPVSPPVVLEDPLLAAVPVVDGAKRLGTCILTAKLGQGGMGAVYRGFHTRLNLPVAVKILPFHLAAGANADSARQRFHREAQLAVQLDHPNLIRVMDVDSSDQNLYYLIMEYVEGNTVGQALRRHLEKSNRPLPERTVVSLGAQVASAIGYAHGKNIIHRDIKPDNIMIRKGDGRVKLMDLGLAKAMDADEEVSMTSTGMGSPHYISPEQASDAKHATAASDVYSIGATLYHLITGQTAFQAPSIYALVKKIHEDPPEDPRNYCPGISDGLRELILRCLEKDPAKRPTAADLFRDLRALGETLAAVPVGSVPPAGASAAMVSTAATITDSAHRRPATAVPGTAPAAARLAATVSGTSPTVARLPGGPPARPGSPTATAKRTAPQPAGRRGVGLYIALGVGGGLLLLALVIGLWVRHSNAVVAQARADLVDGILQQVQPRLAVRDFEQAETLFKTIPPDADPDQIAVTAQTVQAGVAKRAAELAFLRAVETKFVAIFKEIGAAPDRPVITPVTKIEPVDPARDFTPQLRIDVGPSTVWEAHLRVHPDAWADMDLKVPVEKNHHQLQLHFLNRDGLLDYIDVLKPDLAPNDPAAGLRLLSLSQGRFQKIFWQIQVQGDDGTLKNGTDLVVRVNREGDLKVNGHSAQLPDLTALLKEIDEKSGGDTRPLRPGLVERGDRKGPQKITGSAKLAASAGGVPDGFSRLLKIFKAVESKPEPDFAKWARELTETLTQAELTIEQPSRAVNRFQFDLTALPEGQFHLQIAAFADSRPAFAMLERLPLKLIFLAALDPKNAERFDLSRESDPSKFETRLIGRFKPAGVEKFLEEVWKGNGYNKPSP